MRTTTLKPGIIVLLKTKIVGGVEYQKTDLTAPDAPPGADAKRWETTRIVGNPEAWEQARTARSRAQTAVRGACIKSDFGLLCPVAREEQLTSAVDEAQGIAETFNASDGARVAGIRVEVFVISGRIATDDAQAMRAISSEVRGLLEQMQAGIAATDVDAIRAAASRARAMGAMLDEQSAGHVHRAIAEAREVAKAIVRRVQGEGETAEKVLADFKLSELSAARFAFLDLDGGTSAARDQLPAVDGNRVAGLDLSDAPVAPTGPVAGGAPARDLDADAPAPRAPVAPGPQREIEI